MRHKQNMFQFRKLFHVLNMKLLRDKWLEYFFLSLNFFYYKATTTITSTSLICSCSSLICTSSSLICTSRIICPCSSLISLICSSTITINLFCCKSTSLIRLTIWRVCSTSCSLESYIFSC